MCKSVSRLLVKQGSLPKQFHMRQIILKDRLDNSYAYKIYIIFNNLQLSKKKKKQNHHQSKPKYILRRLMEKLCLVYMSISHTYTNALDRSIYYTGTCFDYRQFIIINGFPEGPPQKMNNFLLTLIESNEPQEKAHGHFAFKFWNASLSKIYFLRNLFSSYFTVHLNFTAK